MATHNGYDVAEIQRLLAAAGFDPGPIDGAYGPLTTKAVHAFQVAHGLNPDGDVGPITWGALNGQGGEPAQQTAQPAATSSVSADPNQAALQLYPQYAWAMNDPELGPIFREAASADPPWDMAHLQGALYRTSWWQQNSSSARSAILQQQTDPATYGQNVQQTRQRVEDIAAQSGIVLPGPNADEIANMAVRLGWSDGDIRRQLTLPGVHFFGDSPVLAEVRAATADYGIQLPPDTITEWATNIASGSYTMDNLRAHLLELAKGKYPGIAKQLDQGMTVSQIAAPYVQQAANDLGLSPNAIDIQDPKWSVPLSYWTDKGAQAMTLYDWTRWYKTHPEYGYDRSPQAREQSASFVHAIASEFGAVG